jgi:hypothetical protein
MTNEIAKQLIERNFPPSLRSKFSPLVRRAYENADLLFGQVDFLDWKVGGDLKRYLRRIAVEYGFKELAETDRYDFEFAIKPNTINNCRHIELITKECVLTISQVTHLNALPRQADFRQNHAVSNQLLLDFPFEYNQLSDSNDRFYAVLTHGYLRRIPDFVSLGIPSTSMKEWHYKINLINEFMQFEHHTSENIKIDQEEVKVRLKEYIKSQGEVVNEGR